MGDGGLLIAVQPAIDMESNATMSNISRINHISKDITKCLLRVNADILLNRGVKYFEHQKGSFKILFLYLYFENKTCNTSIL